MQDILDKLAHGVIGGPDDLMGIGECLNLIEELEREPELAESRRQCIDQLKDLFNRIILEESGDVNGNWETVQELMGKLLAEPPEGESSTDWETIQKLMEEVSKDDVTQDSRPEHQSGESQEAHTEEQSSTLPIETSEAAEIQDPDLLKDFLEEAKEHLASIELNILTLESNPDDKEAINAIFRPFHSIKGVAGFLNLRDIHHLSHEAESLLDEARSGRLDITDEVIDIILQAVDILKGLFGDLDSALSQGLSAAPSSPALVASFLDLLHDFHKGQSTDSGAPTRKLGEILIERGIISADAVEKAAAQSKSKGTRLGEELISEGAVGPRDISLALREQRQARESAASVRVDTQKLDNLVDMVGELVIAQSMVLQNQEVISIKDQQLQKDSVQLKRITNELQRISMSMRMVPIKSTFQKMIRLVRDLSKKSGKEVTLEMKGEETEIDRNMVEEIYEPLVHMIRNSVDHGIELPAERENVGKARNGTIRISAAQKGGNIVIDIEDDGRGLDVDKIRAKAIERNIITAEDQLDEKSIFDLIFHPGFSTNDRITEVSGRGVGMDVVKRSVERLRGKMETWSMLGKGTHFQFKIPLTMAIIDGMIIQVGSERYVVPTIALKESFRPAPEAYMTVQKEGEMINVRNSLMPLIRLHQVFGVEPRCRDPWEGLLLVVHEGSRSFCLLADEIVARQEVVIKSLGSSLRGVTGISGGAILGDGRVALIVDVKGIVSHHGGNGR